MEFYDKIEFIQMGLFIDFMNACERIVIDLGIVSELRKQTKIPKKEKLFDAKGSYILFSGDSYII